MGQNQQGALHDWLLSYDIIDEAPAEIRALFHAYDARAVCDCLSMAGINGPPSDYAPAVFAEGIANTRKMLIAEERRRQAAFEAALLPENNEVAQR